MSNLLQAALEYASYGWRVHPLHHMVNGKCSCGKKCGNSAGKHPIFTAWKTQATTDEELIDQWWSEHPDANLGVVFGRESGIIDIECDGPEIEERLTEIFGGEFPVCPTFTSSKGKHRIFKWTEELPCLDKDGFKISGIEFRTGSNSSGQQSVFPPSQHHTGKQYTWLIHPSEIDPPEIPPKVLDRIFEELGFERGGAPRSSKTDEEWQRIIEGVGEGERNQSMVSLIGKTLRQIDVHDNDAVRTQYLMLMAVNQNNKPPLDEIEVRRAFMSILKKEQQRRTNDEFEESMSKFIDIKDLEKPESPMRPVGDWKLVIVESNPRVFRLYSPLWSSMTDEGFIELTAAQFLSADSIAVQAAEQAKVWVEKDFKKIWNGTSQKKGLGAQLMESAETIDAPTEEHRFRWVAECLLKELESARLWREEDGFTGWPQNKEGSIYFDFSRVFEKYSYGPDAIKRKEFSKAVQKAHGKPFKTRNKAGKFMRLKVIPPKGIESLNWIVYGSPSGDEDLGTVALSENVSATHLSSDVSNN